VSTLSGFPEAAELLPRKLWCCLLSFLEKCLILLFITVGKVHGSLARAGKVRGQAPKVPKQEKKKKPTGRAMKRVKYNRRFVNVGA
jgi:small subunit ribosomal protein S30e